MTRPYTRWTEDMENLAYELYKLGYMRKEIARTLNVSSGEAVGHKLRRLAINDKIKILMTGSKAIYSYRACRTPWEEAPEKRRAACINTMAHVLSVLECNGYTVSRG